MLTVAVLGPLEVHRDGDAVALPTGKSSELLVRLALDVGTRVRVDALLDDLWGEPTARNTLQSKVSQLRRALGKDVVVAAGDGYRLALPRAAVDAARVEELAAAGSAARLEGDLGTALDRAEQALALFRGAALPDVGDWAAPHRTRWDDLRLELAEQVLAIRIELGAGGELVSALEALVDAHPLRERLWEALIIALYRSGRQADALEAYGRIRRLLDSELGIEPGPKLESLQRQVLRQESSLLAPPTPIVMPGNLPADLPEIIGRDAEATAVRAALERHRLVTVLGPGGVGKTRLALEVARTLSAPGGVWLVRLDTVGPGDDLGRLLADTLRVTDSGPALRERLAGAETIIVLDTCEHVVQDVRLLADRLLDAAPTLRILATSQAPLGSPTEHEYQLRPLGPSDASALFIRRARERRDLVVDEDTLRIVVEVCSALDGLPLAIELAAARVRALSVGEIARRLDDRFAVVRDPGSPHRDRRRALAGAIAWSYDLLAPDDHTVLWALAGCAGGAPLDGLEAVTAALELPPEALLDTVERLVSRSLAVVETGEHDTVRYRLLDSIRAYATARATEAGAGEVIAAAHARWCADLAARCDRDVRSAYQPHCVSLALAERMNIDAASAWCADHDRRLGLEMAANWGWTWVVLGDGVAAAARIRAALTDEAPVQDRVRALLLAGWLEASAGDVALAQADLDQARGLAAELDEVVGADVDRHQAFVAIQQGRADVARDAADRSLAVYREHQHAWSIAASLLLRAYATLMIGDIGAAKLSVAEALELLEPIADSWGLVHATGMLGVIARSEGRFADAAGAFERAAEVATRSGFVGQAALHRANLGRVQQRIGDERAAASLVRAIDEAVAGGDGRLAATARLHLARLRRAAGDDDRARILLARNEKWYARAGGGDFALLNRAHWAAVTDDVDQLEVVRAESRRTRQPEPEAQALDALARLAADAGDTERAAGLLGEADRLAAGLRHVLDDHERLDAAMARHRLG